MKNCHFAGGALGAVIWLGLSGTVAAQMPGTPVLQNAWATPGMVVAADLGSGSGGTAYGAAVGWGPGSGRMQLSAGLGYQSTNNSSGRAVYGIRAAVPLMSMMGGNLGTSAFAGFGGGGGDASDTTLVTTSIPVGIGIGYRRAVTAMGGGMSAYLDPLYRWESGAAKGGGYFRLAAGVDVGFGSRFGVTLGYEGGAAAGTGKVGPPGSSYGLGVTMKLGR